MRSEATHTFDRFEREERETQDNARQFLRSVHGELGTEEPFSIEDVVEALGLEKVKTNLRQKIGAGQGAFERRLSLVPSDHDPEEVEERYVSIEKILQTGISNGWIEKVDNKKEKYEFTERGVRELE